MDLCSLPTAGRGARKTSAFVKRPRFDTNSEDLTSASEGRTRQLSLHYKMQQWKK